MWSFFKFFSVALVGLFLGTVLIVLVTLLLGCAPQGGPKLPPPIPVGLEKAR